LFEDGRFDEPLNRNMKYNGYVSKPFANQNNDGIGNNSEKPIRLAKITIAL
jgi:hypothetical protein